MKITKVYLIVLVLFLLSALFGISKRDTYTNITKDNEWKDMIYVAPLPEHFLQNLNSGSLKNAMYESSSIIVKVVAIDEMEFVQERTKQMVRVEKVIKGDKELVGHEISVMKLAGRTYLQDEPPSINMGFVNELEVGNEYLIFLETKLETLNPQEEVYIIPGTAVAPIFAYKERESFPAGEETYVLYNQVQDYEYFAQTQEVLDALRALRKTVMEELGELEKE